MEEFKKYTLLYKNYEIGVVTELNSEWPRPSGIIELNAGLKELNEETRFLFDYFNYSIKASYLLENSSTEEYNRFCEDNESKYLSLIDSQNWTLLDKSGKKNSIVIPILSGDNEIVWTAFTN